MKKLLMIDRDGCINQPSRTSKYIQRVEDFFLFDEVPAFFNTAREAKVFEYFGLITNQQGISQGLYSITDVLAMHRVLCESISISKDIFPIFICAHKEHTCQCRKPSPVMLLKCMQYFKVRTEDALFVGDSRSDFLAAKNAGIDFVHMKRGNLTQNIDENCVSISNLNQLLDLY